MLDTSLFTANVHRITIPSHFSCPGHKSLVPDKQTSDMLNAIDTTKTIEGDFQKWPKLSVHFVYFACWSKLELIY